MVESKFLAVGVGFTDEQERRLEYLSGKKLELGILIKHIEMVSCVEIYIYICMD